MLNSVINRAYTFAQLKHAKQFDDNGKPHHLHSAKVALILSLVCDDGNLIAAGYLHDVLEDCDVTYEELAKEFGEEIANLVKEVTHERTLDGKAWCFPELKTRRGYMLKYADRLDNLSRMEVWTEERIASYMAKSKFWTIEVAEE